MKENKEISGKSFTEVNKAVIPRSVGPGVFFPTTAMTIYWSYDIFPARMLHPCTAPQR